jgi:hypothetical protein
MLHSFITLLQQLKLAGFDAKKARLFPQCLHKLIILWTTVKQQGYRVSQAVSYQSFSNFGTVLIG